MGYELNLNPATSFRNEKGSCAGRCKVLTEVYSVDL